MKIFITGADGMLGSNTVRELLQRKFLVKVFLQKGRKSKTLNGLNIERSHGDLMEFDQLNSAMKNCDIVIHAAADTSIWPAKSKLTSSVNIIGTKNCLNAALNNNVKKFIYIGSATSFGYGSLQKPGNESCDFTAGKFGFDYINSKYQAQNLVLDYVKNKNLNAVVINPTFMIGPYDSKPGSGFLLLAILKRKIPGYTKGGKNFVHVRDVAVAICNSIDKGKVGECYITGNTNMSYKKAFKLIADTLEVKAPNIYIPDSFSLIYGLFSEFKYYITSKKPTVSYKTARISQIGNYFTSEKAVNELNMPQTDINVAIKDAFIWFKENNYINK